MRMANSADLDQIAPLGAVTSGTALFAIDFLKTLYLSKFYFQCGKENNISKFLSRSYL